MKLTFPHMGTVVIYKKVMELMGHEIIMPPRPTRHTMELGVKYSPEFACIPFKVITGSYIEALEQGADTIVTSGGFGPCRAGYYCEVHEKTLRHLGYDVEVLVLESAKRDFHYFWRVIKKLKGKNPWRKVISAVFTVYEMAHALDRLEKIVETRRVYEAEKGSFSRAWTEINHRFDREVWNKKDVIRLEKECHAMLDKLEYHPPEPDKRIRLGIVGEIYVVMESAINLNLEEVLNSLGCEVERNLYLSEWIDDNLMPRMFKKTFTQEKVLKLSRQYMEVRIGGHENETIGHIIDYAQHGFDGIVHLMPFACLPELISQSIIPKVSKDYDIPILTLSLDEQTAVANIMTRLEAFIELIRERKAAGKKERTHG